MGHTQETRWLSLGREPKGLGDQRGKETYFCFILPYILNFESCIYTTYFLKSYLQKFKLKNQNQGHL